MNRRQYLTCAGASLGTVALAGCLGTLGDDGEGVTVADRTGERALARSVGQLNDAVLALHAADVDEFDHPEDVSFDADEPRAHLSQAREHLETADAELGADRDADIAELRAYADVLAALIDVTETVADDTLAEDIAAINAAIADEGEPDAAAEILDERTTTVDTAQDRFAETTTGLDDLDAAQLEALAIIDLEEIESGVSQLGDILDSQAALGTGYEAVFDGMAHLERGQDAADDGEHEDAAAAFAEAETAFETATQRFETGKTNAPAGFVGYFETALCQSGNFADAASAFAEASTAAGDGDVVTARDRQADGEDALDDARSCA